MRIFSKFHDYYDPVAAHGHDDKVTYQRDTKEFKPSKEFKKVWALVTEPDVQTRDWRERYLPVEYVTGHLLIFCGKFYPAVSFLRRPDRLMYSLDEMKEEARSISHLKFYGEANPWELFTSDLYYGHERQRMAGALACIERFLDWKGKEHESLTDLHRDAGTPILYGNNDSRHGWRYYENPELKKLGFQRIFPPFQAFQEIEMYVAGVMGGQAPPMVEVSNATRIAKQGFDKWSFRTPPGQKGQNAHRKGNA